MSTSTVLYLALVLLLLVVLGVYFSHVAGRLDRAHLKVESTRAALHTNVAYRSSLALDLARLDTLDPTLAAELAKAARAAREEEVADSGWHQESVLTAALTAALADDEARRRTEVAAPDTVADLASVCRRVQYSRRFHNDAVSQARALHGRFLARTFRLAGHAPNPEYIDFDDSVPAGLAIG